MKTCLHCNNEVQSRELRITPSLVWGVCDSPAVGELLPDYIAELLADSIAEEVEDHLLDCLHCREKYLKVLSISDALRRAKARCGDKNGYELPDERTSSAAKVFKMSDFKKRRP